jgi:hypothetical protein
MRWNTVTLAISALPAAGRWRFLAIALALLTAGCKDDPAAIPTEQCREAGTVDCRTLQPDECERTNGCVYYEHAKWPSCRSVSDRSRVELFGPRSTTAIRGQRPANGRGNPSRHHLSRHRCSYVAFSARVRQT